MIRPTFLGALIALHLNRPTTTTMKKNQGNPLTLANSDQLHETVDEVARLEVHKRALEAKRDKAIQAVRADHDAKIGEVDTKIKALVSLAGIYCKAKKETVFGKLKSAVSALAKFGFREGNPSLCLLNKKWSWEQVLERLKEVDRMEFVRTVEEIDKEKLKASKLTDAELADFGLRIDSKERFYVEPKGDDTTRINDEAESAAA